MITALITAATILAMLSAAAWKWELKWRHYLPWSLLMAVSGAGICYLGIVSLPAIPSLMWALVTVVSAGIASLGALLFFFFRDPERSPPHDDDVIVSPADGTVVYVKEISDGNFPFAVKNNNRIPLSEFATENLVPERGLQIGIAMNYLNVHVNRSPIRGQVNMVKAVPGKFASLKHLTSLLDNERALLVFENEHLKVGIVQIASRLVRRIVSYVQAGQSVAQGDRVGMIKFGSQVDVLLPLYPGLEVQVEVGDELTAGESVILRCPHVTDGGAASTTERSQSAEVGV